MIDILSFILLIALVFASTLCLMIKTQDVLNTGMLGFVPFFLYFLGQLFIILIGLNSL